MLWQLLKKKMVTGGDGGEAEAIKKISEDVIVSYWVKVPLDRGGGFFSSMGYIIFLSGEIGRRALYLRFLYLLWIWILLQGLYRRREKGERE